MVAHDRLIPVSAPDDESDPESPATHDLDLARLAASLRRVMPRVDDEARDRLERAWVAVTNAVKQPGVDAARLARRLRRLREELDGWVLRGAADDAGEVDADEPPGDGKPQE